MTTEKSISKHWAHVPGFSPSLLKLSSWVSHYWVLKATFWWSTARVWVRWWSIHQSEETWGTENLVQNPKLTKTSHSFLSQGMWLISQQGYTYLITATKENVSQANLFPQHNLQRAVIWWRSFETYKVIYFFVVGPYCYAWFLLQWLDLGNKMMGN